MEIGFIVTHVSHGSPGSFVRVQEIAKHLNNLNNKVTILTPFEEDVENIPELDLEVIRSTMSSLGLMSKSYNIARKMASSPLTAGLFLSSGSINRMARSLEHGIQQILAKRSFEILHTVQPIAALACSKPAREKKIPLVADLHNIMPEEILAQGLCNRNDRTFSSLHDVEQTVIELADAVTVVSEEMRNYLIANYSASGVKPIVVVPPCGAVAPLATKTDRKRNVVYAGMVNFREHVDLFAKSIPYVKGTASFYISDYGDSIKFVKSITSKNSKQVKYTWFKQRRDVLDLLTNSRIGVLTSRNDITRQLGPPLKLYDYLACGLPVIANDVGGWSKLIESKGVGLVCRDEPREFAKCIDYLLSSDEMWSQMHDNAIRLIKDESNWSKVVEGKLMPLYCKLFDN